MSKLKILTILTLPFLLTLSQPCYSFGPNPSSTTSATNRLQNRLEQTIQETNQSEEQQVRETTKEQFQQNLQNQKQIQEQLRNQFKEKLQQIKDLRKQKILEKIDQSLANINRRWTTHFTNVLNRLTKILEKIQNRKEAQNNPAIQAKIQTIAQQIQTTKTAVTNQAAKEYTLQITTEEKLGEAVQKAHESLRSDLQALRDQIKDIRESIRNLLLELKQNPSPTP